MSSHSRRCVIGDFLASLFGGQNKVLNNDISQFGADAGFAQQQGQGDVTAASKFYQDILSGDPTKIGQSLAPEISTSQQQGQQAKNNLAQFGNRSGGTNAAAQGIDAAGRGNIINLIGGLQGKAASGAGSLGTAEQGLSLEATNQQEQAAQQRFQNWLNSIGAGAITSGANFGLKAIGL